MAEGVNITRTVATEAADTKTGMTLDELAAFVQEAMLQEIPGDTAVKVTTNWRAMIKKITAEGGRGSRRHGESGAELGE